MDMRGRRRNRRSEGCMRDEEGEEGRESMMGGQMTGGCVWRRKEDLIEEKCQLVNQATTGCS